MLLKNEKIQVSAEWENENEKKNQKNSESYGI